MVDNSGLPSQITASKSIPHIWFFAAVYVGKNGFERSRVARLTFPNDENFPAEGSDGCGVSLVPFDIAGAFLSPEFGARRRYDFAIAAVVAMPEAAMYENRGAMFRQNDVGISWEISAVEAKAIAERMQRRSYF